MAALATVPRVIRSDARIMPPRMTVRIGPQLRKMETTERGKDFMEICTSNETTRMCPIATHHTHRFTFVQVSSKLCCSRSFQCFRPDWGPRMAKVPKHLKKSS